MSNFNLREQLVRRIRRLPDSAMPRIEEVISELEQRQSTLAAEFAGTPETQPEGGIQKPSIKSEPSKSWPHAPTHRLSQHGTYIVTAGTLHKEHFFRGDSRLSLLEAKLLELALEYEWQLEAWAVFSNHYHFVAHSGPMAGSLKTMISRLHSETATAINTADQEQSRQVWHNFWDTALTIETSYLARLNYVHQNAVKHGLVKVANQYQWCSARWFEQTATPAQVKTIYGFGTSKVRVFDDF